MYAKIFKQNYQFQSLHLNNTSHGKTIGSNQQSQANQLIGLLTTIDNLKPEYKVKYEENFVKKNVANPKTKPFEFAPLDLSVKISGSGAGSGCGGGGGGGNETIITPPITPNLVLPLSSPLKKRYRNDENFENTATENPPIKSALTDVTASANDIFELKNATGEVTPKKPIKPTPPVKTSKNSGRTKKDSTSKKQHKAVRKLKFDEHKSSPVSGTIIRSLDEIDETMIEKCGDIDPQYNIVEVTDEAKAELAQITNVIGAYICKLCRIEFEDAFGLARHRCSCIVLLEYRCPECGKRFNCPANLASHRRWHKPRDQINTGGANNNQKSSDSAPVVVVGGEQFKCNECGKFFKRQAYLRKHQLTHRKSSAEEFSNESNDSNNSSTINNNNNNNRNNNNLNYSTQLIFHIEPTTTTMLSSSPNNSDNYDDDDDDDSASEASERVMHPHKKFRLMSDNLTEDENIAAAALAFLRNGTSVIKHTTALAV